jgi:AraC-like DNA-binding protein
MTAFQTPQSRPAPSPQEIASAVSLLRTFAPDTLASATPRGVGITTSAPNHVRETSSGLAPWQLKRAKALFDAHLRGGISVEQVARACGLSRSQFSHAFRISIGMPPHAWLIRRRVEKARETMRASRMALSEVALVCGFSDQSHFTRQFHRVAGETPRAWRRLHMTDKQCLAA